eukprot:366454-Chlamydomonas_euryale.AAC.2
MRAVELATSAPIMLLTGDAGCGKTLTTKAIVHRWLGAGKRVRMCAPTGRAAQRLQVGTAGGRDAGSRRPRRLHLCPSGRGGVRFIPVCLFISATHPSVCTYTCVHVMDVRALCEHLAWSRHMVWLTLSGHMFGMTLSGHMFVSTWSGHMFVLTWSGHMFVLALSGHMFVLALSGHMFVLALSGHMFVLAQPARTLWLTQPLHIFSSTQLAYKLLLAEPGRVLRTTRSWLACLLAAQPVAAQPVAAHRVAAQPVAASLRPSPPGADASPLAS